MKTIINTIYLSLIVIAFVCLSLSQTAQGVNPPPDGGYPNQNTAEGDNALLNLVGGTNNTAVGFAALYSNTMGNGNTAIGYQAIEGNIMGARNTATGVNALEENTTGMRNTAYGYNALYNSNGSDNIALGANAGVYVSLDAEGILIEASRLGIIAILLAGLVAVVSSAPLPILPWFRASPAGLLLMIHSLDCLGIIMPFSYWPFSDCSVSNSFCA